jgi:hypothetical protein
MKLQFASRAYALAVPFVVEIVSLFERIPRAIGTYHP